MWVNRKHLCGLILLLFCCIGFSQNTSIPDSNFEQALIDLGYDSAPINGTVLTANINTITNLNVSNKNITNLSGIEDFTALEVLNCNNNSINVLNISQNTSLSELYCNDNELSSLNVSALVNLKIFWCANNQLTNLNVTNNSNLISLVCANNLLTSLNVTNNPTLNVLSFENNQISNIDVTQNNTLNSLLTRQNLITNLDVSQNLDLTFLDCGINQITSLDVSLNTNLRVLLCFNNNLTELDVTQNTRLSDLSCEFNQLTQLDMSQNTSLVNLDCSDNNLCILNVKNGTNTNTTIMDFSSNPNLSCVIVDNASDNHLNWNPFPFSNYVNNPSDCANTVLVDTLDDFIGINYTLPILNNGDYYTQSNGNGMQLQTGDVINTSQTIFIYNQGICNNNESSFNVLITDENYFIPKYFTPNNDGTHDFWKVKDFSNSIKNITVFNKYGKLLKSFPPNSEGWNGTFNGKLLNTDDYWYLITLNSGELLRGHFTLKR